MTQQNSILYIKLHILKSLKILDLNDLRRFADGVETCDYYGGKLKLGGGQVVTVLSVRHGESCDDESQ